MPEEHDGHDGDAGEVDRDIAKCVAELCEEGASADGFDNAAGRVGEIEDGAEFVENDEGEEEGEDVQRTRAEEPVGLGAFGSNRSGGLSVASGHGGGG